MAVVCFHALAVYPKFGTIFLPSISISPQSLITRNATLLGPRGTTERLVWGLKLLLRKVEISTAPSGNLAISFYCQPQIQINYIYNYIIYCTVVHPTTMNLIHLLEKLIYLRKKFSCHMLFLNIKTFQIQIFGYHWCHQTSLQIQSHKRTWHPATAETETWSIGIPFSHRLISMVIGFLHLVFYSHPQHCASCPATKSSKKPEWKLIPCCTCATHHTYHPITASRCQTPQFTRWLKRPQDTVPPRTAALPVSSHQDWHFRRCLFVPLDKLILKAKHLKFTMGWYHAMPSLHKE